MNLFARLDALEAQKTIADTLRAPMPKTATERAERNDTILWEARVYDPKIQALAPPLDGYWPFVQRSAGRARIPLRFDALRPIVEASGHPLYTLMLDMAESVRPTEGGDIEYYFAQGDDVPLVTIWFEPQDGHDLL